MRVAIVTGTSGYIGSRIAGRLENDGWKVMRLTRDVYDVAKDPDGSKLRQIFAHEKPDAVFHLASLYLATHAAGDLPALIESNVLLGTRILQTLVETASAPNSIRPVFISAGTGWQNFSKTETVPVNLYAATKSAFNNIARYYSSAFGLRTCELRLFDTYGPSDPRRKVVRLLLEATLSDASATPIDFSPGEQKLHLVYIDDAVDAFMRAETWLSEQRASTHASFRVDSEKPITLKSLALEIEILTKRKVSVRWGSRPYREREVMEPYSEHPRVPGWSPKVSLAEGLNNVYRSLGSKPGHC